MVLGADPNFENPTSLLRCLRKLCILQEKSKLPDEATEMTGCVFCCPSFTSLVEKHRAITVRPQTNRASRGRVKGKGKGRSKPPKDKMQQLADYFV